MKLFPKNTSELELMLFKGNHHFTLEIFLTRLFFDTHTRHFLQAATQSAYTFNPLNGTKAHIRIIMSHAPFNLLKANRHLIKISQRPLPRTCRIFHVFSVVGWFFPHSILPASSLNNVLLEMCFRNKTLAESLAAGVTFEFIALHKGFRNKRLVPTYG